MKCFKHNSIDAVGVCAWCGRGMCRDCAPSTEAGRMTCSADCAKDLASQSEALEILLDRSVQTAKASAFYCYLSAGLSAAAAVAAWYMLPSPFLMYFAGGSAVVLVAAGWWHGHVGKKGR
jgi:hypothetical protein